MSFLKNKKVAIVYDRVNKWGGAERVLLSIHEMFPKAPLFTSVYDSKKAPWASVFPRVYTSFLQHIPFAKKWHEGLGWIMPLVFESFDFSDFDLVISVTSEAAKGIITLPKTTHVCYMLTPTRYLWSHNELYFKNRFLRFISKPIVVYLKKWDKIASKRPDKMIAISSVVQRRIKQYYDLDSEIIFPPNMLNPKRNIATNEDKIPKGQYYLVVGRLVPYKKVDLAIEVFNRLNKKLIIVGSGSGTAKLKSISKKNIEFAGEVDQTKLEDYYTGAKALIMPQEEDFGLVAVEAQSFGVPVIAFAKSGARDCIICGKTGVFFKKQNEEELIQAIANCEKIRFNHNYLLKNAKRFDKRRFQRQLQRSLIRTYFGGRRRNTSLAKIAQ